MHEFPPLDIKPFKMNCEQYEGWIFLINNRPCSWGITLCAVFDIMATEVDTILMAHNAKRFLNPALSSWNYYFENESDIIAVIETLISSAKLRGMYL